MMSSNYGSISEPSGSGSNNFSPTEFLILKETIYNNILLIKKNNSKLERIQKVIGSKNDTSEVRSKIQKSQQTTNDIIKVTSADIKKLNSIVKFSSTQEKANYLAMEKILSDFNLIVQTYLVTEKNLSLKLRKTVLVNVEDSDEEDQTVTIQQRQLQQANLNFEKQLLVEREVAFQKIESEVVDINQIMKEISTLIHEQGEGLQTIDNAISQVEEDVEGGVSELEKAASSQQKFRRKVLIVLIIALVIAFLVLFSLYSKLK